eukprot:scaffold13312_cov109-Skeletonema_marinoi.AAC.2
MYKVAGCRTACRSRTSQRSLYQQSTYYPTMMENPDSYASSGENSFSSSAGDHDDDGSYSTEDDDGHTSSGSDNDDNVGIPSDDDDDSSTQDVLMDDLMDEQEEEFSTPSRIKSLIIAALMVLLAGLVLNFSYVLVQLNTSRPEMTDRSNALMKNSADDSIYSDKNNIMNNIQSSGYNEPKQNKLVREKTGIYKFTGLHGNKHRGGGVLSDAMIEQYEEDGVIVFRNLISSKLLDKLDEASEILVNEHQEKEGRKKRQQFHMVKNHAIFLGVPSTDKQSCSSSNEEGVCIPKDDETETDDDIADDDDTMSAFRHLAMYSKIPRVAASLLRLDELRVGGAEHLNLPRQLPDDPEPNHTVDDSINLRICRDIFLTKDDDDYACGWHVDDTGFWPSIASDPGVNAWIALDDMPYQWSRKKLPKHLATDDEQPPTNQTHTAVATFALSLGSHRAPWRQEAYEVTGSTHTLPPEGFLSAADMIKRRSGKGTCNIKTSAPHLYEKLEENKIVYDIKKGDVIFHDRWLFHRTVTVAEYEKQLMNDLGESLKLERSDKIFRRYSIRYSPGSARVPPGYGVEPSVLYNAANANRTLDEIVESDGPWYPEVWPRLKENDETDNIGGLVDLVHEKMPQAEIARDERKKEIRMALKKGGGP